MWAVPAFFAHIFSATAMIPSKSEPPKFVIVCPRAILKSSMVLAVPAEVVVLPLVASPLNGQQNWGCGIYTLLHVM